MFYGKSGAFVVEKILCNSFVWVFGDLPVPKDQLGPAQNASLIVPAQVAEFSGTEPIDPYSELLIAKIGKYTIK